MMNEKAEFTDMSSNRPELRIRYEHRNTSNQHCAAPGGKDGFRPGESLSEKIICGPGVTTRERKRETPGEGKGGGGRQREKKKDLLNLDLYLVYQFLITILAPGYFKHD